jgi:hypothetical protein
MTMGRAVIVAVVGAGWIGMLSAQPEDPPKAVECPLHAAHQGAASAHRQGVDERHDEATGVSHADSVHHFTLYPDGGAIRLETNDEKDLAGRDRIRGHLSHIARAFGEGQFDLPMFIHDRTPPGVDVMRRLRSAIHYHYRPTPRGGAVDITTANPEAREAVHAFLRFQIEDHGTGDTQEVVPR